MGLRIAFETLGEVVEHYESHARSVRDVETTARPEDDGGLSATLSVAVPRDSLRAAETGPVEATLDDDEVRLSVSLGTLPTPPSTADAAVSVTDVVVADASEPVVRLVVSIQPTAAASSSSAAASLTAAPSASTTADTQIHSASATPATSPSGAEPETTPTDDPSMSAAVDPADDSSSRFAAVRDESVPPYEDTAYLEALYEECDTFREMSRRIAMDVSSETVRRYMIDAGVHQPASYDTADADTDADSTDAPPTDDGATDDGATDRDAEIGSTVAVAETGLGDASIATDGLGLPAAIDVEDVADAVVGAATVHQVQRQLGLDRERTRDLLEELNLIDLVSRRLVDSDRTVSYDQIADRLSQCAPSGA